jgi:hypothetical protein
MPRYKFCHLFYFLVYILQMARVLVVLKLSVQIIVKSIVDEIGGGVFCLLVDGLLMFLTKSKWL